MNITDNKISRPGIENGRQLLGFISLGIILDETEIKNIVKYNVKPMGTKTTIPAKKQFLNLLNIEISNLFRLL